MWNLAFCINRLINFIFMQLSKFVHKGKMLKKNLFVKILKINKKLGLHPNTACC